MSQLRLFVGSFSQLRLSEFLPRMSHEELFGLRHEVAVAKGNG
jgi:hypothetical protein